jgi:succinylarginine dihydrolase
MSGFEVNFDGLVGPTHNYAGLSYGNIASQSNQQDRSNPKEAALQGLAKMKALHDMGFKQGVLLPHERPFIPVLKSLGYTGTDAHIIERVAKDQPALLSAVSSASAMWTANAATVSPSADTADGKVHFTPANLNAKFHRSIEHEGTGRMLKALFASDDHFVHHDALPPIAYFGDEGAANHTRFCAAYDNPGVEFFVYGQQAFSATAAKPSIYPARQTLEASQAIARLHGLNAGCAVFAQQNPLTIDAGVFHNDVISVGNRNVLFYHQSAFLDTDGVLRDLDRQLQGASLVPVMVSERDVSLQDAVGSYLFNSQLLSHADQQMSLVVPGECRENPAVSAYLDTLIADTTNPISKVQVFDLKQSMKNGGGPACLRLRVALNDRELAAVNPATLMSDALYQRLVAWVDSHYRDRLSTDDLADPQLLIESRTALDALTQILNVGSIYDFQRL